jgi:hypothetical protein
VEKREAASILSDRREDLADSTRTGRGPRSRVLTLLALATALDAQRVQAVRPTPYVRGSAGYADRAGDWGEAPEGARPWDAA